MSYPFSTSEPAANSNPSNSQPVMLQNNISNSALIAIDHVGFGNSQGGQHNQVTFAANNIPAGTVTPPVLFTKTVGSLPQLFFYSGAPSVAANQYAIGSTGSTFLMGGIILKWGFVAYSSSGGTQTFTLDNPFPNSTLAIIVSPKNYNSGNSWAAALPGGPSQFTIKATENLDYYYQIIGY